VTLHKSAKHEKMCLHNSIVLAVPDHCAFGGGLGHYGMLVRPHCEHRRVGRLLLRGRNALPFGKLLQQDHGRKAPAHSNRLAAVQNKEAFVSGLAAVLTKRL